MRKALEHTRRQVNQAMTVMGRLLRFAQPHSGPAECCGLAAAVQEALDTATRPLEKDAIALSVTVPAGVWVSAPRELLVQVLLNLVLNARQAMAGGRGRLGISARVEDNRVLIEICDTGHGIPGDRLASVINPFLAGGADQPSPWTTVGLGLNVCRMIARHCGATIQAAANADGGCTFRLHWPGGTNRSEPRP
jgi:signal transduction histidine kinase